MQISMIVMLLSLSACFESENNTPNPLDPKFEKYWYNGEAEITSYKLEQARYGEIHEGKAVHVFVTEPFSKTSMTKADRPKKNDPSVLKLNYTKKFNTGIYPYSMMTSTFLPVEDPAHSIKISSSNQEWCGHSYMELLNKNKFEINTFSYFESETKSLKLEKELLEDDIWSRIRMNPADLPIGKKKMIPSFFYLRLAHKETKAYSVIASKTDNSANGTSTYKMEYPELERSMSINFDSSFPYQINSWTEDGYSGFGSNKKKLSTTGKKIKSIKSAYWSKNSNTDLPMRAELGL